MNNIKMLRVQNNLSQKELSAKLNVSQGTLSNWERGEYDIDNQSLAKLADIFAVTTDFILGRSAIQIAAEEIAKASVEATIAPTQQKPTLTEEDERDIVKQADKMIAGLSGNDLMLNGKPASPEAIELLRNSIMDGIRNAKIVNKMKEGSDNE